MILARASMHRIDYGTGVCATGIVLLTLSAIIFQLRRPDPRPELVSS
jgi:hypothetical protein